MKFTFTISDIFLFSGNGSPLPIDSDENYNHDIQVDVSAVKLLKSCKNGKKEAGVMAPLSHSNIVRYGQPLFLFCTFFTV